MRKNAREGREKCSKKVQLPRHTVYNTNMRLCGFLPLVLIIGCSGPSTLPLGLVAGLSGQASELGVSGRNGALLALEEFNSARQHGQPEFELLDWDDQATPETLKQGLQSLYRRGVRIVIGPYISAMGEEAVKTARELDMFLISPTISSTVFDHQDDPLFRVTSSLVGEASILAEFVIRRLGLNNIVVIYDPGNKVYAESYVQAFTNAAKGSALQIGAPIALSHAEAAPLKQVTEQVRRENPDAVLLITPGRLTALAVQSLRLAGYRGEFLLTGWSTTGDSFQWGGSALQGAYTSLFFTSFDSNPALQEFRRRYCNRFGSEPSFSSFYSYLAVQTVIQALRGRWYYPGWQTFRDWILELGPQETAFQPLRFDRYGDNQFQARIFRIDGGNLVPVDFEPAARGP